MLQAEEVRERLFWGLFILKPEHLCQDRLGTNIGKALKTSGVCLRVCFLAGRIIQSTRAQQAAAARMGLSSHLRLVRKR